MKCLINIKNTLFFLVLTLIVNSSCTENIESWENEYGNIEMKFSFADFMVNGLPNTLEEENKINDIKACIFTNGILSEIYEDISLSQEGNFNIHVNEPKGNLYVVANVSELNTWHDMTIGTLTETDWKKRLVEMSENNKAKSYFTGYSELDNHIPGTPLSLVLKRGVARFDLDIKSTSSIVKSVKISNVAASAFFLPQETIKTPDNTSFIDITSTIQQELSEMRIPGVLYVYEQENKGMSLIITVEKNGELKHIEKELPISEIKRNNVYTIVLEDKENGDLFLTMTVDEWIDGEDTDLRPDFDTKILLNSTGSILDGASISEDKRTLTIPHYASEMVISVDCDNELEAFYEGVDLVKVEPYKEGGKVSRNKFLIKKKQVAPGNHYEDGKICFKRKGLEHIYQEDKITIDFMENNSISIEGKLNFDENSVCFFNDYIDGELGILEVEEGKEVVASFENGEDNWVLVKNDIEDNKNKYRIIGGWKPNDPTANGREQIVKLTIRDKEDAVNSKEEVYTVKRRNFGLPVVELNGIWWCKYNAIGNSRNFEDQILSSNDPAVKVNKTVQDYLNQCSSDDFIRLWNATYMGNTGKALKAIYKNDKFTLDGWYDEKVHINMIDPKSIAPSGYELVSFSDYKHIFRPRGVPENSWAEYTPELPGNSDYNVRIMRTYRKDLIIDGKNLPPQMVIAVESTKNRGTEPLMFYGVGCQWNSGGGINHDWLIMASKWSDSNSPWAWAWNQSGANLTTNGAGANNTRTVRFRKSPVEYIYE